MTPGKGELESPGLTLSVGAGGTQNAGCYFLGEIWRFFFFVYACNYFILFLIETSALVFGDSKRGTNREGK